MARPDLEAGADQYYPNCVVAAADVNDTVIQGPRGWVHQLDDNWKH
jgi:hypothetical protein